jgi:hypothetical protein
VTRTISDATQRLMRLNWFDEALDVRAVSRARRPRRSSRRATPARSVARAQSRRAATSAILPLDLDRVVVEQRAALLRIELEHFLVGASYAGRLR